MRGGVRRRSRSRGQDDVSPPRERSPPETEVEEREAQHTGMRPLRDVNVQHPRLDRIEMWYPGQQKAKRPAQVMQVTSSVFQQNLARQYKQSGVQEVKIPDIPMFEKGKEAYWATVMAMNGNPYFTVQD